jgi:hypothetical protein
MANCNFETMSEQLYKKHSQENKHGMNYKVSLNIDKPSATEQLESILKGPDWSQLPSMNQKAYFNMFQHVCGEMMKLTQMKNNDYAESSDAFANFKTIEQITHGRISVESGILVRMTDKLKRIGSLLSRSAVVKTEKIEDTVFDLAVYSVILLVYLRSKNVGQAGSNTTETSDR